VGAQEFGSEKKKVIARLREENLLSSTHNLLHISVQGVQKTRAQGYCNTKLSQQAATFQKTSFLTFGGDLL